MSFDINTHITTEIPKLNKIQEGRWTCKTLHGFEGDIIRRDCFSVSLTLDARAKYRGSYTSNDGVLHWMWFASFKRASEFVYSRLSFLESDFKARAAIKSTKQ